METILDQSWHKGDKVLLRGDDQIRDVISVGLLTDTLSVFGIIGEVKMIDVQILYHSENKRLHD